MCCHFPELTPQVEPAPFILHQFQEDAVNNLLKKVSVLATISLKPGIPSLDTSSLGRQCATAIARIILVKFFIALDTMAVRGQDPTVFGPGYVHRGSLCSEELLVSLAKAGKR